MEINTYEMIESYLKARQFWCFQFNAGWMVVQGWGTNFQVFRSASTLCATKT